MNRPAHVTLALAAAATITTLSSVPRAHADAETRARQLHQQGQAAMAKKDYRDARWKFKRAASIIPKPEYLTALCVASVVELEHMARPDLNLAMALDSCDRAAKAPSGAHSAQIRSHIKRAMRIKSDLEAKRLAANAAGRARSGYLDAAESQMRKAIKLAPKPDYHFGLCGILQAKRRYADAIASCNTAAATPGPVRAKAVARIAKIRAILASGTASPKARAALQAASRAERSASFVDVARVGGDSDLDNAIRTTKACVDAVKAATAGGVPATAETRVDNSKPYKRGRRHQRPGHTATHYAPLSEIQTGCQRKLDALSVLPAKRGVENVMFYVAALKQRTNPGSHAWLPVKMAYDKCVAQVKRSRSLGVADATAFTAKSVPLTLGTAADKGCGIALPVIAAAKGAAASGNAAKFAPYKRALRGDKWRVFLKYKMINFYVFGRGGKKLSSPRALARAGVWFEHLNTGTHRQWAMRRYKFNRKNRLVSKRRLSGRGKHPPSRAYR